MGILVKKLSTFSGHRDSVYTLERADEPSLFFSGAGDGMVVLWDMQSPDEGHRIAQLSNSIYALHLHAETNLLIAGHNYEGIHWLDWKNRKEVSSLAITSEAIFDIKAHGSKCFVACGDGTVVVIDLNSFTVVRRLKNSEKSARSLAIDPIRGQLAVGYSDHFIRIFSLDDLQLTNEWQAHTNSVFAVTYSPDLKWLLSGSRDARLKVWATDDKFALFEEIPAHLYAINDVVFSPDGKHFVTCSLDKSVKVWDTESLTLLKVIDKARHAGHGTSVNKLLWTGFHQQVLSASDDRTISSWDVIF